MTYFPLVYRLSRWRYGLFRFYYYLRHVPLEYLPRTWVQKKITDLLAEKAKLPEEMQREIDARVAYCNRINAPFHVSLEALHHLRTQGVSEQFNMQWTHSFRRKGSSAYFYDLLANLRYFHDDHPLYYEFGDIVHIPPVPTIVKSRPVNGNNANSVLMKLDSVRHFYIPPDRVPFHAKQKRLVWRGAAHQEHRLAFLRRFCDHPLCDVGCVHPHSRYERYHKGFLTIQNQLNYAFILSMEGNDVATNLKWILASNSLCFMTRPRYETWLLEGRLKPDYHFVCLADDYSDLAEKLHFYQHHPDAALNIIRAANAYIQPFYNPTLERMTQLLVLEKYFKWQVTE